MLQMSNTCFDGRLAAAQSASAIDEQSPSATKAVTLEEFVDHFLDAAVLRDNFVVQVAHGGF